VGNGLRNLCRLQLRVAEIYLLLRQILWRNRRSRRNENDQSGKAARRPHSPLRNASLQPCPPTHPH
jgi:hypothetical protein